MPKRMGLQNQCVSVPRVPRAIPKDVVKLLVAPFDESGILNIFLLIVQCHYLVLVTRRNFC